MKSFSSRNLDIQLPAQLWEKGCGEHLWDFGQQISGPAINHAAKTLCGHVHCHSLCGPAQLFESEIRKRTISSGYHGFESGECCARDQMPCQGKPPVELPRHSEVFCQITSGMKELCLGRWTGYIIWTPVKLQIK